MKILAALLALSATLALAQAPAKDAKQPAAPKAPATKPAEAAKPAVPAKPAAAAFLGNKDSKTLHKADCKTAAKMKEANKVAFATKEEAEKQGYKACKVCLK